MPGVAASFGNDRHAERHYAARSRRSDSARPASIATREQLDEWEAENILRAERWLAARRRKDVLDDGFLRDLHRRMFDRTWKWAGRYRSSEKNIGVPPERIAVDVRNLVQDAKVQIEQRVAPFDEIAARFHHRLVSIHAFANGNGRHARLATDLLLATNGVPEFAWGRGDLVHDGEVRQRYIAALQAADRGDYFPLLGFVRSATSQ